jgi:hypothetical protein
MPSSPRTHRKGRPRAASATGDISRLVGKPKDAMKDDAPKPRPKPPKRHQPQFKPANRGGNELWRPACECGWSMKRAVGKRRAERFYNQHLQRQQRIQQLSRNARSFGNRGGYG